MSASLCVGFHGEDQHDAFRVAVSDQEDIGGSYVDAIVCGPPRELEDEGFLGDFCVRPTVRKD